jgi:hypothetical protein
VVSEFVYTLNQFPAYQSDLTLLQVMQGMVMLPTGEDEEYPLLGVFGCLQMHDEVGTGTTVGEEVVVEELEVEHGPTEVEIVGDGAVGPVGGYFDLQAEGEHDLPGQ